MEAIKLDIPEVVFLKPRKFEDTRGFFAETFNVRKAAQAGLPTTYVQDNHSLSVQKGTIRGLHFQRPPTAQDKLVRVLRGSILDVAVDIRHGSPTYGRFVHAVLTAKGMEHLFIPKGFAHGFCTLEENTEVFYKVSDYYSPEDDAGIVWNDSDIGISWPVPAQQAVLSEKDKALPSFKAFTENTPVFPYKAEETTHEQSEQKGKAA